MKSLNVVTLLALITTVISVIHPHSNIPSFQAGFPPPYFDISNTIGFVNVRSPPYNATGDGKTDETAAFQAALNDVGSQGGGIVYVPTGNYLIAKNLIVPASTTLKGVSSHVPRSYGDPLTGNVAGTTLFAVADAGNPNGVPFISLQGDSCGIEGLSIYYPKQVETGNPIQYPWTIRAGAAGKSMENIFVKNVMLVNPWRGIDLATFMAPRHWIEHVYGQPINIGITVDQCYDIGRIDHIHFWPFWSQKQPLLDYMNNNAITFVFLRTDWEIVNDVFSWGYHIGMTFAQSKNGACNGQFSNINFDQVDVGIDVYDTQPAGIIFSNLNLANAGGGKIRIGILGHEGSSFVVVRGASFWGQFNQNVLWSNGGVLTLSESLFMQWNSTVPAVDIQKGRVTLQGSFFHDKVGKAVVVQPTADRVIITGNDLTGNTIQIINNTRVINANNLA